MDGSRFDQIARGMAAGSTRRTLLKSLGGGALAALGLSRTADGVDAGGNKPPTPKPQSVCTKDARCLAGLVCQSDGSRNWCQPGCRIGGASPPTGGTTSPRSARRWGSRGRPSIDT
jgi:hypothetical protein